MALLPAPVMWNARILEFEPQRWAPESCAQTSQPTQVSWVIGWQPTVTRGQPMVVEKNRWWSESYEGWLDFSVDFGSKTTIVCAGVYACRPCVCVCVCDLYYLRGRSICSHEMAGVFGSVCCRLFAPVIHPFCGIRTPVCVRLGNLGAGPSVCPQK